MKITITQDDIDLGEPESPNSCPAARAGKRITGKQFFIDIDLGNKDNPKIECYIDDNGDFTKQTKIIKGEKKLIKFINDFDAGKEVKPITFEIEDIK